MCQKSVMGGRLSIMGISTILVEIHIAKPLNPFRATPGATKMPQLALQILALHFAKFRA